MKGKVVFYSAQPMVVMVTLVGIGYSLQTDQLEMLKAVPINSSPSPQSPSLPPLSWSSLRWFGIAPAPFAEPEHIEGPSRLSPPAVYSLSFSITPAPIAVQGLFF